MANSPSVSYVLGMSRPWTHEFEVELSFDGLDTNDSTLTVSLPVWRSGRYLVLDLPGGVVSFDAADKDGTKLDWKKTDKQSWLIKTKQARQVNIKYKVFANEFHLRTRGLNDERGFINAAAVLMYAEKYRWLPLSLSVVPYGNWHITTGLDIVAGKQNVFTAPNYDHLADCPLEIGTQKDFPFTVEGKPHILSISGEGNYDADTLIRDISKIVKAASEFWGGLPYERYVFLLALSPNGGGGTEHINSTVMLSRPFVFKNPDSYLGFLGLVSHEFFHTWNVKQLRPAAINTYDWTKESYSEELWVAEGTTSYFDDIVLVRAGFVTESRYLERLTSSVESDRGRPGNLKQSVAESSFDAWIKYWKGNTHAVNYEADYYSRGAAVSFALDMTIRRSSKNEHSLEDVMRLMYKRFPVGKGGYTNDDLQRVSEELGNARLDAFFNDYVYGTKPLPWDELLNVAGLELVDKEPELKPWLGLHTNDDGGRVNVWRVIEGSPAYEAGVDFGDEILAMDGYKVRSRDLNSRVAEMKAGDRITLTVFRDDRLREFVVTLRNPDRIPQRVVKIEEPDSLQKAVYNSWLKLKEPEVR